MASRGNSALGDECSETQGSGCRNEEVVRNSGLNTHAQPYVPTCLQSPRNAMLPGAMNGYIFEPHSFPQEMHPHNQSDLSHNVGNGVYPSVIPVDPSTISMTYPNPGHPVYFHPSPLMLVQRPDMYGRFHHESGAREEGYPGSLNSTTPVCNTTSTSSSGTSHPPPWISATSATAAALPSLFSTTPVSANSDSASFSHVPHYYDQASKMSYQLQAPSSLIQNKRQPDYPYRVANPPSNSMITVQNCNVSVALISNPSASFTGETQHPLPAQATPLPHPQISTPFGSSCMYPGIPVQYTTYNHAVEFNIPNQSMQARNLPPKSRASTDARAPVPRGRLHSRGGSDSRRHRLSENDRSSMSSSTTNRNSINEDGCDFPDADYNTQSSNEVDFHRSRNALMEQNTSIPHHLEGSPLIINQRSANFIPYTMRNMPASQAVPLRMNVPQAGESAPDSGCSSPCDVPIVVSTSVSMPTSLPNLETTNSSAYNGLAIDQSLDVSHTVQSEEITVSYEPGGPYPDSTLAHGSSASYVSETFVGPGTCEDAYVSLPSVSNGPSAYTMVTSESNDSGNTTEAAPAYEKALSQSAYEPSNILNNDGQVNQSWKSPDLETPLQETPAVYTATVTAHHVPTHPTIEARETAPNVSMKNDQETTVALELEESNLSANCSTQSKSPPCLEPSLESPESELGDLKPIFETREEHNLSFSITFGDFTRETLILELEKSKISSPTLKSRAGGVCSQDILLSITSSNPVFDTSISSPTTKSSINFINLPENEDAVASSSAVQRTGNVDETHENVEACSVSQPALMDDASCSAATSTDALPANEVVTDPTPEIPATPYSSKANGVPSGPESSAVHASSQPSQGNTIDKPPLPSAPKKQTPVNNATGRPASAIGAATVDPPASSAWAKNKNWKEEFKGNSSEYRHKSTAIISPMIRNGVLEEDRFAPNVAADLASPAAGASAAGVPPPPVDGAAIKLDKIKVGGFLSEYKTNSNSVTLQPRGLTNKNYWCYANTVLQALTAVPQFFNLYTAMQQQAGVAVTPHTMPISYSIISYLKEFSMMNSSAINLDARARKKTGQNVVNLPEIQLGDPFEPSSIQNMLLDKPGGQFMEGCQQDAEEMLSFLLNASHDEFNECLRLAALEKEKLSGRKAPAAAILPNGQTDESNDDWVTMGPKNKTCITRTTEFTHSPISEIFWGESRVIIKKGNSPVTNNLEPFITLPLDIQDENVKSVKEALHQFVSKADVAGYTCTDTQEELTVSSQRLLEQLPQVLILQLKRFVYLKDGGLQKVIKDISLSVDLEISKELISQQRRKKLSSEKMKYKLVSVIYHDGKDANKGHYVCNIYHPGYHCWLHYDDACVKPIVSAELQRCYAPRVPYLLFYRRLDTFDGETAPCAIQSLPNPRRTKDRRNQANDKISCERRVHAESRPSNNGPGAVESHSRVSSIDRKPASTERKVPERNINANSQKANNKRQDKKQAKNKQVAKN